MEKTPVVRSFRHHFEQKARERNNRCNKREKKRERERCSIRSDSVVLCCDNDEGEVFCVTAIVMGHTKTKTEIFDIENTKRIYLRAIRFLICAVHFNPNTSGC